MLNIFHLFKTIISDEVKLKINLKLKGIQEACNWLQFDVSSISEKIDVNKLDENNVRNERVIWENVAKLSIDFFLDYDYYKQFTFQNNFRGYDYDEKMGKLGFIEVDGFWISERKPNRETVIENVFLSCLYRSIEMKMNQSRINVTNDIEHISVVPDYPSRGNEPDILRNDRLNCVDNEITTSTGESSNYTVEKDLHKDVDSSENVNLTRERVKEEHRNYSNEMVGNDGLGNIKCNVCGNLLEIFDLQCSICQEPVEQTIRSIEELNYANKFIEISKDEEKEINSDIPACSIENEENKMIKGQAEMDKCEANIDINLAWECENCEEINENENLSCVKCKNPRREGWTCQHCSASNDKQINQCIACNLVNDVMEEKYCGRCGIDDVIRDGLCNDCLIRSPRWKCWYRFCMKENDGDDKYCKYCGLDRNADRNNVTKIWRCKDGITDQIWICDKCDLINENDMNFICYDCGVARNNTGNESNIKIDGFENNPMNMKQDGWRCEKCQFLNGRDLSICVNCSAPRFWTCRKCSIENKISNYKCIACNQKREFCKRCKNNEIIVGGLCGICLSVVLKWKCSYELCRQINVGNNKYCTHCGLDRTYIKIHGGLVLQRWGTMIVEKWICGKCYTLNDTRNNYCSKYACQTGRIIHKF